jgi:23S rRNA pseudouridine2605 synthase
MESSRHPFLCLRRLPMRPRQKPKSPRLSRPAGTPSTEGQRLQKVLAAAGVDSRRRCEELILAGRVEIDRRVVTELGVRVDPDAQEIRLDGVPLRRSKRLYYAVNKPSGVISTNSDPSGRPRVVDLVPAGDARMFTVGRLDLYSEGLILLTNDGELANRLAHPRYGVEKVYRVLVAGSPTPEALAQLRRGIHLAEARVQIAKITVKSRYKKSTALEMVLDEGRNREIRRALAKIGHKVEQLIRVAVGPVRLGELPSGKCRPLTSVEIRALQDVGRGRKANVEERKTTTGKRGGTARSSRASAARRKPVGKKQSSKRTLGGRPSRGQGRIMTPD